MNPKPKITRAEKLSITLAVVLIVCVVSIMIAAGLEIWKYIDSLN